MGQRDLTPAQDGGPALYHVLAFWADEAEERAIFASERGEAAESVDTLRARYPHGVTPIWSVDFSVKPPVARMVWTCSQGRTLVAV